MNKDITFNINLLNSQNTILYILKSIIIDLLTLYLNKTNDDYCLQITSYKRSTFARVHFLIMLQTQT